MTPIHESNLCCVLSSVGTLYGKDICQKCLKDVLNKLPYDPEATAILSILNEFTLHG